MNATTEQETEKQPTNLAHTHMMHHNLTKQLRGVEDSTPAGCSTTDLENGAKQVRRQSPVVCGAELVQEGVWYPDFEVYTHYSSVMMQ